MTQEVLLQQELLNSLGKLLSCWFWNIMETSLWENDLTKPALL